MLADAAISALKKSGTKSERAFQKKEALREAFASVPLQDKLRVKELLRLDFEMFGFDPEPDEVFPKETFKHNPPGFSYFRL